ncbi:hypothetical protein DFQ00_102292 [Paenibacillus barcinonensis]|nr:hypothetical protein DFQ00_102292 [Paenibacillus barcinonensis]
MYGNIKLKEELIINNTTYIDKHWKYYERNNGDIQLTSRKTKKELKKYWYTQWELFKESEDYLLSILPDCKWCNGGGVERASIWDTGYACPDCRGTGKDGWQYDKYGKMSMMKEFVKPSENALRLKRKGALKHKWVEQ